MQSLALNLVSVRLLGRAPLAQLDRASVYGTEGCWFEPSGVYSEALVNQELLSFPENATSGACQESSKFLKFVPNLM